MDGQSGVGWKVTSETTVYDCSPWIKLCRQEIELPNGKKVNDYHRIVLPDFAVMYVETGAGEVIVERQYKHGVGKVTLTLPAGLLNKGENPMEAAQRELLEETGYEAEGWEFLGSFVQNSNYGGSKAHMYRARNARRVAKPNSGDLEEMEILLMKPEAVMAALRKNEFHVAIFAATIAMATHPGMGRGGSSAD
jgi:ADP-ribose pyrophosphatase